MGLHGDLRRLDDKAKEYERRVRDTVRAEVQQLRASGHEKAATEVERWAKEVLEPSLFRRETEINRIHSDHDKNCGCGEKMSG